MGAMEKTFATFYTAFINAPPEDLQKVYDVIKEQRDKLLAGESLTLPDGYSKKKMIIEQGDMMMWLGKRIIQLKRGES